jgi:hypothetical protein
MNQSVPATVDASLQKWHRMVERRDLAALPALLHPDVVFRSPAAFRPYEGAAAVALILRTVLGVLEDFAYERQFASADGFDVALEFRAQVGEKQLKGIDLIRISTPRPDHRLRGDDPAGQRVAGTGRRNGPQACGSSAGRRHILTVGGEGGEVSPRRPRGAGR